MMRICRAGRGPADRRHYENGGRDELRKFHANSLRLPPNNVTRAPKKIALYYECEFIRDAEGFFYL